MIARFLAGVVKAKRAKCELSSCGALFVDDREGGPERKYCCDEHRWRAARERDETTSPLEGLVYRCAFEPCGLVFAPKRRGQKFCRVECRIARWAGGGRVRGGAGVALDAVADEPLGDVG